MNEVKKNGTRNKTACLMCGRKSAESICDACRDKVQAEACRRKKKEEGKK